MAIRRFAALAGLLSFAVLIFASHVRAEEPHKSDDDSWKIHGRVVDEEGKPVDDFVAAIFWSSNGKLWDGNGKRIHPRGHDEIAAYWKDEGVLLPFPDETAKRLEHGEFEITVDDRPRVSVFATDKAQQRGGFVSVEKTDCDKPVTITLLPLVRVTGKVFCLQANRVPDWSVAVVHPAGDAENYLHFTLCGSMRGEFFLLLPPGSYDLAVHSDSPDARMPRPAEREAHDAPADMPAYVGGIRLEVPRGQASMDLGTLNVIIPKGRGDYSAFYDAIKAKMQEPFSGNGSLALAT